MVPTDIAERLVVARCTAAWHGPGQDENEETIQRLLLEFRRKGFSSAFPL
jgi:hypothetical protein